MQVSDIQFNSDKFAFYGHVMSSIRRHTEDDSNGVTI